MAFETSVRGADDLGRFNEDSCLQPVLGPATAPREGFVPAVVLPGGNEGILEEGVECFFEVGIGAGGVTVVDGGADRFQERRHSEGLPVAAFVSFAAPLITEVARESFFPGLPIGVIAQRLDGEERRLSARPE